LLKEGMNQPEKQLELTSGAASLDESVKKKYLEDVSSLRHKITEALNLYDLGALTKTDWSSSRDAEFIMDTLACHTADEVFTMLKASSKIGNDLQNPFTCESEDGSIQRPFCLERLNEAMAESTEGKGDSKNRVVVLRKWHEGHNRGMEFRAFVSQDGNLIGVSQKDDTASYEFLQGEELKATIFAQIKDVIANKVVPAYKEAWTDLLGEEVETDLSLVVDFYIDIAPRHRAWVQDLSPFLPSEGDGDSAVSGCLFEWSEI
jgi:hypothetical protein